MPGNARLPQQQNKFSPPSEALAEEGSTVIHVRASKEALSAYGTISGLRGE